MVWKALGIFDGVPALDVGDLPFNFQVFVLGLLHRTLVVRACSIKLLVVESWELQDEVLRIGEWLPSLIVELLGTVE